MKLDRFFPPVVATGTETAVTAEGKFPNWPPSVDCDRPDVSVSTGTDSGKLLVKVAKGASPGVAWIRFYEDQSATSLVPLLLSTVKVQTETEPNDKRSQANPLSLPCVVAGRLAKNGDSDAYAVRVKAGQTLVVSATANQILKSPMDAVLQLSDTRGNVLSQSDDVRGLDPQIVFATDVDQDLLIRLFAFPETPNSTIGFAGSAAFVYSLDVTTGPFVDHVASDGKTFAPFGYNLDLQRAFETVTSNVESASRISPPVASIPGAIGWSWITPGNDGANRVLPENDFDGKLPAVFYGHFSRPRQTHRYTFSAINGTKYRAEVRSKSDGFLVDSKLTITDHESGNTLAINDDVSRGRYDAGADFVAKNDGAIDVAVSELLDGFGPRHFYQLSIRRVLPHCQLSIATDHFVLTQGKRLDVAIAMKRSPGFNRRVELVATGLPESIDFEPVISESKGDTSKSVKLKLNALEDAGWHGKFRIVGIVLDAEGKRTDETIEATFALRPSISTTEFWLTIPPAATNKATP